MEDKKLGKFKQAVLDAAARAGQAKIAEDGFVLYQYPDYDTYREVQTAGNKAKLGAQFVKQSHAEDPVGLSGPAAGCGAFRDLPGHPAGGPNRHGSATSLAPAWM